MSNTLGWRAAKKADEGRLARFRDVRSPTDDWWFGILTKVEEDSFDKDFSLLFHCQLGGDRDNFIKQFCFCEVQYSEEEELFRLGFETMARQMIHPKTTALEMAKMAIGAT